MVARKVNERHSTPTNESCKLDTLEKCLDFAIQATTESRSRLEELITAEVVTLRKRRRILSLLDHIKRDLIIYEEAKTNSSAIQRL